MKYLKEAKTLEELRKQYKELLKKYHPDNAEGSTAATQEINAEYDKLFKILKDKHETGPEQEAASGATYDYKADQALRETLEKVVNLDGIEIEICGSWIWVSGNTYQHRDTLKESGFKWAAKKKLWYWHGEEWQKKTRKAVSMQDIREKYGSEKIHAREKALLGA